MGLMALNGGREDAYRRLSRRLCECAVVALQHDQHLCDVSTVAEAERGRGRAQFIDKLQSGLV